MESTATAHPQESKSVPIDDLPLIGCLPLDLLVYIATFVGENELIKLTSCSRTLRSGLIRCRFLWANQLTLNVARPDLADQIRTLYLERIHSTEPALMTPSHNSSTHSLTAKWLARMNQDVNLTLKRLRIRLHAPQVTIDAIQNKLVIIPDEPYWNTQSIILNFKLIKDLMHKPLFSSSTIDARSASHQPTEPDGLHSLEIRLDGQFEQTLAAAHEAWLLCQTPWAKTLKEYRLSVGYGLARIPSFSLVALSTWMPSLKTFEIRITSLTSPHHQDSNLRRQQQRFVLGGTDVTETTPGLKSAQLIPCRIENLHLEGLCFSNNLQPANHQLLILPHHFPNLKRLVLKSITWGRMIFELIRRSSLSLESLKLDDFSFDQELEEDLPSDWNFNYWEDDTSEVGSDEGGMISVKVPPIQTVSLKELELIGEGTPHIWSVLGECIQNPIIKMPNLENLVCECLDLEEEEQALIDLADLAPNLRQLAIRNCILRDEVDLYHCIRCLPDLEVLDFRLTENITSNLINTLALSVPNIRHLDVRGCPYVQVTAVARLAEMIRDSSDSERRIELIGVDKPMRPNFGLESAQEDSVKWEVWQLWQAWSWLEFTHVLLDEEEWKERHRGRKGKQPIVLPCSNTPNQINSGQGPRIRLTYRAQPQDDPSRDRSPQDDDDPNEHELEQELEEEEEEEEQDEYDDQTDVTKLGHRQLMNEDSHSYLHQHPTQYHQHPQHPRYVRINVPGIGIAESKSDGSGLEFEGDKEITSRPKEAERRSSQLQPSPSPSPPPSGATCIHPTTKTFESVEPIYGDEDGDEDDDDDRERPSRRIDLPTPSLPRPILSSSSPRHDDPDCRSTSSDSNLNPHRTIPHPPPLPN